MGWVWDRYGTGMGQVWDRYGTGKGRDGELDNILKYVDYELLDYPIPKWH